MDSDYDFQDLFCRIDEEIGQLVNFFDRVPNFFIIQFVLTLDKIVLEISLKTTTDLSQEL